MHEVGLPYRCPECGGSGKKEYYPCFKCEGTGYLVKAMLTYGEDYNTSGQPMRQMFAGYIEIAKRKPAYCQF